MTSTNNDSNSTDRYMTEEQLTDMENRIRADFKSGKIDEKAVWTLIQEHATDLAVGCQFSPSRAVAIIAVMLHKLPIALDLLIENNPDSREKLEVTQTAFRMLQDSLYARYKVSEVLKDDEYYEFAKQSWAEMNAFMSVTTTFQDMCYMSAVINYVSQQMVADWAEFLEDGFNADKALGLKTWKEIAAAAELANKTI